MVKSLIKRALNCLHDWRTSQVTQTNSLWYNTLVCFVTASFLLWAIYRLLVQAKLALPVDCFFMAQACVVFLVAPYLAASRFLGGYFGSPSTRSTASLLRLSRISFGWQLLRVLLISQVSLLCWVLLSTAIAFFLTSIPFLKILQMFTILVVYSLSAGAVGLWGARVFKDALFGTECAYLLWCVLIGGVFLLAPLDRYIDNIQPVISPVLHINPLIAVCYIFEIDPFRSPFVYKLTPVGSYHVPYTPWYLVGFWQLLIGICCFFGVWRISNPYRHIL